MIKIIRDVGAKVVKDGPRGGWPQFFVEFSNEKIALKVLKILYRPKDGQEYFNDNIKK